MEPARAVSDVSGHRPLNTVTAWLQYQLAGDQTAKEVFFGPAPTLKQDTAWSDFARTSKADAS
ncbi:hypothetical protein GCM10027258_60140 [Amycolatopsis stemonae]